MTYLGPKGKMKYGPKKDTVSEYDRGYIRYTDVWTFRTYIFSVDR